MDRGAGSSAAHHRLATGCSRKMLKRTNVLGVGISAINLQMAVDTIEEWIRNRKQHYVCITGVHGVIESQRDPALKRIHNRSGMTTPDGMPLVWLSRLNGQKHVRRVYGPDLMLLVCEASLVHGFRHFLFGGAEGVPEDLAQQLRNRFPGLQIVGTYSPPFRPLSPSEDESIVRMINEADPDIVWIGLSTPKQERWMAEHLGKLHAPVMIGVGAAFDFHSGRKKQAPRWMQRSGLEWLFRLLTEPRRLWRRYLINNPLFLWLVTLQLLRLRQFPLEGLDNGDL